MLGRPASENHFGEPVTAEKAPKVISNEISNLPSEQLYKFMKQMKECVQVMLLKYSHYMDYIAM